MFDGTGVIETGDSVNQNEILVQKECVFAK